MENVSPYATVEESSRAVWGRRVLRLMFAAVLALLLLRGVQATFFAGTAAAPTRTAATPTLAEAQAGGIASRFVTNYLTVGTGDAAGRARMDAMKADLVGEWSPEPLTVTTPQQVIQTIPAGVVESRPGHGVATVLAQVSSGEAKAGAPTVTWAALAVPVTQQGGRVFVEGSPAFVSLPKPAESGAAAAPNAPSYDQDMSTQTQGGVTATFRALASADPSSLAQVVAPGSTLTPITGAQFRAVESWQVEEGSGDTRQGRAVVRWAMPAGEVRQPYLVSLRSVTSGKSTDWRVTAVTAAAN